MKRMDLTAPHGAIATPFNIPEAHIGSQQQVIDGTSHWFECRPLMSKVNYSIEGPMLDHLSVSSPGFDGTYPILSCADVGPLRLIVD